MTTLWSGDDIHFMRLALQEAEQADRLDEVPVGAVLVAEGALLGRGHNHPIRQNDPTAHAEVMALRDAGAWTRNYRFAGATLYVTLEPCLMCFGALLHARVDRVVFGASDPKVGVSRWLDSLEGAKLNHSFTFEGGLLEAECRDLLQGFFKRRRQA
ncbi:MAG: tRNA adenosine(34) deaminase TadA [Holophagaceae bacterium]